MTRRLLIVLALLVLASMSNRISAQADTLCLDISEVQAQNGRYVYRVKLNLPLATGQTVVVTPTYPNDEVQVSPPTRSLTAANATLGRIFSFTLTDEDDPQTVFDALLHAGDLTPETDGDPIFECGLLATPMPTPTTTPTLMPTLAGTPAPGVAFAPITLSLIEGGDEATINLRTLIAPNLTESLTILPLFDPVQVSISPNIRDITASNWNDGRPFSFRALADDLDEGDHSVQVTFYITSSDPLSDYFNLTVPVRLTINIEDAE